MFAPPAAPATRRLVTGCVLLVLPLLVTCRFDDLVNPRLSVMRLEVEPAELTLRSLGEESPPLGASALDFRNRPIRAPAIDWSSADPTVATVDREGRVTAVANDTTLVVGRADAGADTVRVVVRQAAREITVSPAVDTLATVGERTVLRAVVRDARRNPIPDAKVLWVTSAPDTVVIMADGDSAIVEERREGHAAIVASSTTGDGSAVATAEVRVSYRLRSLTLSPDNPKLDRVGDTLTFTATGEDLNGAPVSNPRAVWTSSAPAILAVDSASGHAVAVDAGTTTVRVEAGGMADETTVEIRPPVLDAVVTPFEDSAPYRSTETRSTTRVVRSLGTLTLGVRATRASGSTWLTITPDTLTLGPTGSPNDTAFIQLTANASGLAEGVHRETVVLQSAGAAGSPKLIPVEFRVSCRAESVAADTSHAAAFAVDDCRSLRRAGSFADLYRFSGSVDDKVWIALTTGAQNNDTYLYLLDASGAILAQNDDCAGRSSCINEFRLAATGDYTIEATTHAPGATFGYTLSLVQQRAPGPATALGQFKPDGTPIPEGGGTNNTTTDFQATATDPNRGDTLRLQVEVRPVSEAFTGTPTHTGSPVPNATGVTLKARATSLAGSGTDYHWQARVIDQTGRFGPWTEFGSGGGADFKVTVTGAVLTVTPDAVRDSAFQGTVVVRRDTLEVLNTGIGPPMSWSATTSLGSGWLKVVGNSGAAGPGEIDTIVVELESRDLVEGTYSDTVVVSATGAEGSPAKIPVTFVIQRPVLNVTPTTVARSTAHGSGASFVDTLRVSNTGSGPLNWSARKVRGAAWLGLSKTSGVAPDDILLTSSSAGLSTGTYDDTVEVTGANAAVSPQLIPVRLVVTPPLPSAPAQQKNDETTSIVVGGTTDESTVKLRATIGEPSATGQVRLDVEVAPVGQAFAGTPTASSGFGAQNRSAVATVANLADDVNFHWQARAVDDSGRASPWVPFGGNVEDAADFRVAVPQDPLAATGPGQFRSDGTTPIASSAHTDESTVRFKATLTDPDPGDQLRLEIELRLVGTTFFNAATAPSAAVTSGTVANVAVSGLTENGLYHWQVRTCDQTGRCSGWASFGTNAEDAADFIVNAVQENPAAPTNLKQFRADGTPIPPNGSTGNNPGTVVLEGLVTDPDPGDLIFLEVEVESGSFDGGGLDRGTTGVTSGNPARVTVTGLSGTIVLGTDYRWRARACDQTNRCSTWVHFGGDNNTDFHVPGL